MNDSQRVVTVSADMTCDADVLRAFDEAKVKMDGDPEIVCACAGKALLSKDVVFILTLLSNPHRCGLSQIVRRSYCGGF